MDFFYNKSASDWKTLKTTYNKFFRKMNPRQELYERIGRFTKKCAAHAGIPTPTVLLQSGKMQPNGSANVERGRPVVTINEGLLSRPWPEIEYVLAHEIGHLRERRFTKRVAPSTSAFKRALPVLFAILATALWFSFVTIIPMPIAIIASFLLFAGYSILEVLWNWRYEFRADLFACHYVGTEGFKSFADNVTKERLDTNCETHPSWARRLRYIERKLN